MSTRAPYFITKLYAHFSFAQATLNGNIYLDTPANFSYRKCKKRKLKLYSKMERRRIISNSQRDALNERFF
jgi:hypothetical protein